MWRATENNSVVQAPLDNSIMRGLDPAVFLLFIVGGAEALCQATRCTFWEHTPIRRCQIHNGRYGIARLPKPLHVSVRNLRLRQIVGQFPAGYVRRDGRGEASSPEAQTLLGLHSREARL